MIAEINLSCLHEAGRGMKRRHGVGVVMVILFQFISIHFNIVGYYYAVGKCYRSHRATPDRLNCWLACIFPPTGTMF